MIIRGSAEEQTVSGLLAAAARGLWEWMFLRQRTKSCNKLRIPTVLSHFLLEPFYVFCPFSPILPGARNLSPYLDLSGAQGGGTENQQDLHTLILTR